MTQLPRIIFFGTPAFAVASLQRIVEAGYPVVAVVTSADKPAGRGLTLRFSAVKEYALSQDIPLFQPTNLKDPDFIATLSALLPDLQIVIAFRMMPRSVWSLAPMGTFNLHASLLPQYRGAAPINRAIMNGETVTGLTTFLLDDQIDTGRILLSETTPIGPMESAGELHDRMMVMGGDLVLRTIELLSGGMVAGEDQSSMTSPGSLLMPAPKLSREDCRLIWDKPAVRLHNQVRGLSPYPGAYCDFIMKDGSTQVLKVFDARPEVVIHNLSPGTFQCEGNLALKVATSDGFLYLNKVQFQGRKAMGIADFLRGFGYLFT